MASLLHILDTDSLEKDPNLKFDPQNASAHLNDNHPTFQDLKEGLTPEQVEILENVTQVDGYELRDQQEHTLNGDEEFIDPETGEKIKIEDTDLTLSDLGFVDPQQLRVLTMEAFYNFNTMELYQTTMGAYGELARLQRQVGKAGFISRVQANNINAAMGGGLYDNVVMESFTQLPTKTNFNLVMEEMDTAKTAMAVGGAIVGATILYKLIKWFMNSWNKNAVASGSIAGNIKNIQERRERLNNSSDIINKANTALAQTIEDLKRSGEMKNEMRDFLSKIQSMKNVNDQQAAINLLGQLELGVAINAIKPVYSNLWLSLSTGQQVKVGGGSLIVNKAFFDSIPLAIGTCKEIQNLVNSQIENIRTTGADKAIQDKDAEYKKALDTLKQFGQIMGYTQTAEKIDEYCNGLMSHILQNVVAPLGDNIMIKDVPKPEQLNVINPEAWANVNDDYEKDVAEFQKRITDLTGREEVKNWMGQVKQAGQQDTVNQGNDVQRDSRLAEYEKLTHAFRGSMLVMRALLALRNNVGRGLTALNQASEKVNGK